MNSTPATPSPNAQTDEDLARARRNARHILTFFSVMFVGLTALALIVIEHNNRLAHYPARMEPALVLMIAGAGTLILAACWFAWTRLSHRFLAATWFVAWGVAAMAGMSAVGTLQQLRPLVGSDRYDAAAKEFGDTFVNAAKLTDAEVEASKLISRVASDEAAVAADLRAAMGACDTLIKRLTADASFLENWAQVCREIMRKHGVTESRIEYYAQRMEQQNDTSGLLESNAQLAMLLQARKLELRGRLAGLEQGAATDDGDTESFDK